MAVNTENLFCNSFSDIWLPAAHLLRPKPGSLKPHTGVPLESVFCIFPTGTGTFIYFYNQGCCPLPLFLVSMCCLIFSRLLCMLSSDVFRGLIKLLLVVLLTCIKFLGGPSFFWSQARTAHLAKDRESCWMAASSAWWWLGAHFSPPSDVHRKEMLCMTRSQEWHQEGEHAGSYQRWKLYRVGHTA